MSLHSQILPTVPFCKYSCSRTRAYAYLHIVVDFFATNAVVNGCYKDHLAHICQNINCVALLKKVWWLVLGGGVIKFTIKIWVPFLPSFDKPFSLSDATKKQTWLVFIK